MKPLYETKTITNPQCNIQIFMDYFNERLRIDHYRGNMSMIVKEIHRISEEYGFSKIIFYTRPEHWRELLSKGFEFEAMITGYFNGTDNYIMTSYKKNDRRTTPYWVKEDEILQEIFEKDRNTEEATKIERYHIRKATKQDSIQLASLYEKVFTIYPTPMNQPEYVEKIINQGSIFYVAECGDQLVSAASADVNRTFHNAELTDCATLPYHRKGGIMKQLLIKLENELKENGIYCAFSIARALSFGMNAAFNQLGYHYNGRLINNCYIYDKLENMNVWVKDLSN